MGGVKSAQLSHEDQDFWRLLRAVGDLLKFVKGDGEQQGNYHFISVNQMPASSAEKFGNQVFSSFHKPFVSE